MKKQFVLLALAICLFAAAEMQGLPQDPAVTVYVSGPSAHAIYKTTWGEACEFGAYAGEVYTSGSQFRPTGIEYGSDNLIYFADSSHSEIGRLSLPSLNEPQQFEIISDSSISTLENPTDIIFTATDAIVSSRAGSKKSDAGLYIIRNIAGLDFGDSDIPLPELLSGFGSGGGSSAESFDVLFSRDLIGTESSNDEVLEFEFQDPEFPYADFSGLFATNGAPLGIAGAGVGDKEVIYVGFPKTGEIWKYDRNIVGGNPAPFAILPGRFKPRHIETDLAGNVYVAASHQSGGADGALFCIPPDHPGGNPTTVPVDLPSAYGVAVGAGGSVTATDVRFPAGAENGYKLCGDEITLEIPGYSSVTATLTCQDITPAEFKAELDLSVFPLDGDNNQPVECIPEPGKKSCTLITIVGINEPTLATEFARTMVPFVDFTLASTDVGILYRPTDKFTGEPVGLFSENILTQLEIVDWGFDPGRLTGRKDNFGSEVVFCTGCDTSPVVDAGDDQQICEADDLTLSGTVDDFRLILDRLNYKTEPFPEESENDWLTVKWLDPDGAFIDSTDYEAADGSATATVTGLAAGEHTFTLSADDAYDPDPNNLPDPDPVTDTVTVTVTADDQPPVIVGSASASPALLWPPNHEMIEILIDVATEATCTGAVTCKVTGISINDPVEDDLGDGSTHADYAFGDPLDPLTVVVRAERNQAKGNLGHDTDRVYTIEVTCTNDAAPLGANQAITTVTVTVVEDQGDSGN